MLFEVIGMDKQRKMYTGFESALPDVGQLKSLASAGYSFKLDGKSISTTRMIEYVQHISTASIDSKNSTPKKAHVKPSVDVPAVTKSAKKQLKKLF